MAKFFISLSCSPWSSLKMNACCLLCVLLASVSAQTCQSTWSSFVIKDNNGNEMFSIAENTGVVTAKEITADVIEVDGKNVESTLNTLQSELSAAKDTIAMLSQKGKKILFISMNSEQH